MEGFQSDVIEETYVSSLSPLLPPPKKLFLREKKCSLLWSSDWLQCFEWQNEEPMPLPWGGFTALPIYREEKWLRSGRTVIQSYAQGLFLKQKSKLLGAMWGFCIGAESSLATLWLPAHAL